MSNRERCVDVWLNRDNKRGRKTACVLSRERCVDVWLDGESKRGRNHSDHVAARCCLEGGGEAVATIYRCVRGVRKQGDEYQSSGVKKRSY